MSRDEPKTIFKVRLTREGRDFWVLLKIMLSVFGMIALVGGCQVYYCWGQHPKWTVAECLEP